MSGRRWAGTILVVVVVVMGLILVVQSVAMGVCSWRALSLVVIGLLAGAFLWRRRKPGGDADA